MKSNPSNAFPTRVYVFMGVSGSGKSTLGMAWAKELHLPFVEGDRLHPPDNITKMESGIPLTDRDRQPWLEELNRRARGSLEGGGRGCCIACSALRDRYRQTLGRGLHTQIEFIYLKGGYETILRRLNQRRSHFMPASLLHSQFDTLEEPRNALVVDIDQSTEEQLLQLRAAFLANES